MTDSSSNSSKMTNNLEKKYGKNNDSAKLIEKIPSKIVENELYDILDTVKIIDATCDFEQCKRKTNLIGEDCKFCKKRYCFKHNLPEVHGCGEAIKKSERKNFLSPVPQKTKQNEKDLQDAKKRMNLKMKEMKLQRTKKAK